ncbi:MAG: glycine cleavage system protein GcvH [Pseudohongiellaceae bacterium]
MSKYPDDLKYATTHEWVRLDDDGIATVGISDHAQNALGDIVFVELPEPGAVVLAKSEVAVVESVKAASDIYSPLSGEITDVNEALADSPETVNSVPYEGGWLFRIRPSTLSELDDLLDAEGYQEICEEE